eukprot:13711655-Alexandrium_andersonii.AAC.1
MPTNSLPSMNGPCTARPHASATSLRTRRSGPAIPLARGPSRSSPQRGGGCRRTWNTSRIVPRILHALLWLRFGY